MLKNTLTPRTTLQTHHILTPQQLQYLKILQLPVTSLENTIKHEIEENPFLEEDTDLNDTEILETQLDPFAPAPDQLTSLAETSSASSESSTSDYYGDDYNDHIVSTNFASDERDTFDHYTDY